MNESALNALINLFAIFSIKGKLDYDDGKIGLEEYLSHRLGIRNTDEYISLFYEIYELYSLSPKLLEEVKLIGLIEHICKQLKSKIPHYEQVIVFLHFLELASVDEIEVEDKYYRKVSSIFEINEDEYQIYREFIFSKDSAQLDNKVFLVIGNESCKPSSSLLYLEEKSLEGVILVLYLEDIRQFVFKLFGPDRLMIEGLSIREGNFYTLNQGSIIRGQFKTSIYYSDISLKYFNVKQTNPIEYTATNLSYFFPRSSNGVQKFEFSESSGQLIAVMGGSGVGKSTLLNVLNGSLVPSSGEIRINGFDIHKDFSEIEGLIGFIPQDDLVISELTVFQNVFHNARLCLNHMNKEAIVDKVNSLLHDLDLYEIKDMVVGNPLKKVLSGGQRKRLNIALELIREPSVLFVDEPTSGLSSRDSEKIMILLKEQARQGRLIIVNIHQPSSFIYKLFDKLWILDKGGHPVYAGNPIDAVIYFKELANHIDSDSCECPACGNVNPEQVLDIIESTRIDASGKPTNERVFTPEELYSLYAEKIQDTLEIKPSKEKHKVDINFNKPGRLKQFVIFSARNIQSKLSNKQYIIMNLVMAPLLALIVSLLTRFTGDEGYFFSQNKNFPSFVFMAVVVMLFQGMSLSAEEIFRDRALLQRESFLRLSRFSYINSKVIFLIFVSAVQSLLFTATSFLILEIGGLFMSYWLILFLTAVFANLAGLIISAGLNSVVTIYISIPLLIIPQILLSGLIVPFDDLKSGKSNHNHVPLIGDIMVSRWAFEALTVNQFINNKYTAKFFDVDKEMAGYQIKSDLLIDEINNIAQQLKFDLAAGEKKSDLEKRFDILSKEIARLDEDSIKSEFPKNLLSISRYNSVVYDSLFNHLNALKDLYKKLYRSASDYKENLKYELIDELGHEGVLEMERKYSNESLGILLTKKNQRKDRFVTGEKGIIVKVGPIYRNPESRIGRAHFYAPFKFMGNIRIPTLYFNSLFIILMSVVLYVALYYNWLGKVLNSWPTIKRKLKK